MEWVAALLWNQWQDSPGVPNLGEFHFLYRFFPGAWANCKTVGTEASETSNCSQCGESALGPLHIREALLRLFS